jgi:rhodanese-related sulfurtransferase
MQVVNRDQVQKLIRESDPMVIEALSAQYFEQGHLPHAHQINVDELEAKRHLLPANKERPVVVYCANKACKNSAELGLQLQQLGYTKVLKYEDGKADWKAAGLPLER